MPLRYAKICDCKYAKDEVFLVRPVFSSCLKGEILASLSLGRVKGSLHDRGIELYLEEHSQLNKQNTR